MELASFIMTAIKDTCRTARWLNYLLFYLFPGFALGTGMMRLSMLSAMYLFDQICDYYYNGSINISSGTPEPISFNGIGYSLTYLACETVIYECLAILLDYLTNDIKVKKWFSRKDIDVNRSQEVDDDVAREEERVMSGKAKDDVIQLKKLRKVYNGEKVAVDRITFGLSKGQCFGLLGINGAGKTTTSGKLAGQLRKQGRSPLLVACDVYRPAAIKQLQVVGKNYNIPVFEMGTEVSPVEISKKALEYAAQQHHDVILIDTAGRLHINEELMQELQDIKTAVRPQEILLVVDAMTGQDAVTVAESFDGQLGVDGIILTKLDGDARGGAALSVRSVTNKPIKYIGMGEKMEDLEPFYPDRMASRILGMGDVLSLIDKVQANIDEQEALDMAKKMRANDFTLEDFLAQMQQIKKMGPLKDLLGMMPGIPGMGKLDLDAALNGVDPQKEMARTEAIIQSMTKEERANPSILNGPRKKRIAAGCGRSIADVNRLIKQFEEMKKMMKQMNNMQKGKKGKFPFFR